MTTKSPMKGYYSSVVPSRSTQGVDIVVGAANGLPSRSNTDSPKWRLAPRPWSIESCTRRHHARCRWETGQNSLPLLKHSVLTIYRRRLLIAQDETQIFPVAAGYDDSYVDYLSRHPTNPSFMTMQEYGPSRTNLSDHMEKLAQYAVGFILQISETVLDELLPTPQQKDIGASNTKMTISLRQRGK